MAYVKHASAAFGLAFGLGLGAVPTAVLAQAAAPNVTAGQIGGVVTSPKGPEAGVWVIAETTNLPTKFTKIVVTDDAGRYLIPELPAATYQVWVRGYGLVDSAKVNSLPGRKLDLKAVVAPSAKAAAEYYPAIYWYSMLNIPPKSDFPGTGINGNGISENIKSQEQWLDLVKTDGCFTCHQLGDKPTREISKAIGEFTHSIDAWDRRIQSGQAGGNMTRTIGNMGQRRVLGMFADWTDRIAAGELPAEQPPRPQGQERNVVISMWDWATAKSYMHDEASTDRRNPTVNAYGPIYGAPEESMPMVPVLDPVKHTKTMIEMPVGDPATPDSKNLPILASSPYWGDEPIWKAQTSMHNPMLDEKARVWITTKIRPPETPAHCREGSTLPSAQAFPIKTSGRQLALYDPPTKKITLIETCFGTHHLQFGYDANNTLYFSGSAGVLGWLDRKIFDETGDAKKAIGWSPYILDTNGNGKRDGYVEPDTAADAKKDTRINGSYYGVSPNPADTSIWGSSLGMPGFLLRTVPGANPPQTTLTEKFELPVNDPRAKVQGYSPRGMDIDSKGVVWASLASGHFGEFDRRKCKGPLNGPTATGKHCPEGWTFHRFPGPQFKGIDPTASAEASYYSWVDQHDTFGLGKDVPIATGNGNDALLALADGKFVTLRVPYPLGFYVKGLDGRIDDPNGGWRGRGLWTTWGTRAPFHSEGGKGNTPKVVKFQLRPNPLAG